MVLNGFCQGKCGSDWTSWKSRQHSLNDKECFDDVLPIYTPKPENPKDNPRFKDTKMVSTIDSEMWTILKFG